MSKFETEFEFTLTETLEYHKDGKIQQAKTLLLKAPSNVHRFYVNKLKQAFLQSALNMQKATATNNSKPVNQAEASQDEGMSAATIMSVLLLGGADMNEFYEIFKDMLCKNLCLVDGSVQMTSHLFDNLSLHDGDLLIGKYLEVFFISSWMSLFSGK